jgi:hypothetical protein
MKACPACGMAPLAGGRADGVSEPRRRILVRVLDLSEIDALLRVATPCAAMPPGVRRAAALTTRSEWTSRHDERGTP